MTEKAHSILGASGAERWLNCPGSVRLSAGLPKTSSKYAEEGTAAHELAEMFLRGANMVVGVGTLITVGETAYTVTEEMIEAVSLYIDTVRDDLKEAGPGAILEVEKRFHLDWLYDGMFGTNDALVGQPFGLLQVYDFKFGAGVAVEVEDNAQLMYYALGAAHGETYDEVELVIVQPRAAHPDGPVRRQRMSMAELDRWADQVLLPGAEATADPNAPLCTGSWCKFCPALAICPAQHEKAIATAQFAFAPKPSNPPPPDALPITELRKVLDAADMVESWLNACRAHAKTMLETGMAKPEDIGYKLVAGRATRKWLDDGEVEEFLVATFGDEAYVKKLISPAQAEKIMGKSKKLIEPLVASVRGTQMVPLSDKREALMPALMFEEVEL